MTESDRHGNRPLRAARRAAHLTQEQNAQRLSALAEQMHAAGELSRRTSVSPRQYRRWEGASPPWPHPEHRRLLERFYGRPVTALGFTPPWTVQLPGGSTEEQDGNPGAWERTGADDQSFPWLAQGPATAARPGGLRVGSEEVILLRSVAADMDAIDQRFGGDRLWRSARAHLRWVHHLIEQGTYDQQTGHALRAVAGQLTTSLGWFCYDADEQATARVYFSEALNAAMLNGDDVLATRTLSNMARQAVDLGRAREAVRFARIAQAHGAEWSAPSRVTALLLVREAQGHARGGDPDACGQALARAWQHFGQGPDERDPDWTGFLNEAELRGLEGMCRFDLGQHARAVRLLDHSVRLQAVERTRNRGMCLARLARASIHTRQLDRGVAAAGEALRLVEAGMSSTRNLRQLALVRDGLADSGAGGDVQAMAEQLDEHVA